MLPSRLKVMSLPYDSNLELHFRMAPIRAPFRLGWPRPNPILDALRVSDKELSRDIIRLIPEISSPSVVDGFVRLARQSLLRMELESSEFRDYMHSRFALHRRAMNHRDAVANVAHDCATDYFPRYVIRRMFRISSLV